MESESERPLGVFSFVGASIRHRPPRKQQSTPSCGTKINMDKTWKASVPSLQLINSVVGVSVGINVS